MRKLVVQAAQHALARYGNVVLSAGADTEFFIARLVPAFEERSAVVLEHAGFDQQDTWQTSRCHIHKQRYLCPLFTFAQRRAASSAPLYRVVSVPAPASPNR